MLLATAELPDGAHDQRECLISPAGECVGGAEGRGGDRSPEGDLPPSAEIEVPREDPDAAREIPATEVGEAEVQQPEVQRVRMIGRFSDLHGGLTALDGLVEPAELGEHVGEPGA